MTMKIKRVGELFNEVKESHTFLDLKRDLPDVAQKAVSVIPYWGRAHFMVQNGCGALLAYVSYERGTTAQWYKFDTILDDWVQYTL